MPELPTSIQVIITALITVLGTIYATRSGNVFKSKELSQNAQKEFMATVIEELDGVKEENKEFRKELDQVRDELRSLRAQNTLLERERDEHLRVLRRVAACSVVGCFNAARAAEFIAPKEG